MTGLIDRWAAERKPKPKPLDEVRKSAALLIQALGVADPQVRAARDEANVVRGMTMDDDLKGKLTVGRCLIIIGTEGRSGLNIGNLPLFCVGHVGSDAQSGISLEVRVRLQRRDGWPCV